MICFSFELWTFPIVFAMIHWMFYDDVKYIDSLSNIICCAINTQLQIDTLTETIDPYKSII